MDEILLKSEEIDEIFKNHLKIESKVMSIESLFANLRLERKIIYDPYYQRNYVWDNNKATYFIESILLGTEIPPLVFFNNQETIEIIDGRQRFETIKNFISKKFVLSKNGLHVLKFLDSEDFNSLDSETKEIFWDTKLRLIEFSIVNEPRLDEKKEDLIKKEIFRRYNSGITPLKNPEIEKAIYINDELTKHFKDELKANPEQLKTILELFFTERDVEQIGRRETIDNVMSRIRELLVLNNIPIKRYSTLVGRHDILAQFYSILSTNIDDFDKFYQNFNNKIDINVNLKRALNDQESELSKNRLIYECTFWMLTILENESPNTNFFNNGATISDYADYLIKSGNKFSIENSHFYKKINERYIAVANYFSMHSDLKFNLYLDDYSVFKQNLIKSDNANIDSKEINKLELLRLNKPEPSSMTIEDICRQMLRDKFLVRPIYQRGEVINKAKSSALIESILLGIKIPPIFLYKRIDGIYEVIDGQQRILSILGFLGEDFLDETGIRVKSEKNNFKLSGLRILSEYNGMNHNNLPKDMFNKILDFNLSVVIIDEKINPEFDKIDLFIRLNNKPYPIRDHSFEMWNSYIEKDIISKIKENTKKHSPWFYLKTNKNNRRMDNEELYTSLVYLDYRMQEMGAGDITNAEFLTIYPRENNINVRIKEKSDITRTLNLITTNDEKSRQTFIKCIGNTENFIRKVKIILLDRDCKDQDDLNEYLRTELNKLFYTKSTRRTTQSFYSLWIVLNDLNLEMVKKYREELKNEIIIIFENMKSINEEHDGVAIYKKSLRDFKLKYSPNERKIILSPIEKNKLILKQDNICPICKNSLFIGDEIEVDHIDPLAIGGRDSYLNLQVVHKDCNRKKGANYN
jgi:hypothetical protein